MVVVVERDPSWLPAPMVAKRELVSESMSILSEVLWMATGVGKAQVPESEAGWRMADMDYVIQFHQEDLQ